MLDFQTTSLSPRLKAESLELVLIEVSGQRFAVRASSIQRLENVPSANFKLEPEVHPAMYGYLPFSRTPVFDLARLLDLETGQTNQLLITEKAGRKAAFFVQQAHEVVRIGMDELILLPAIIEQSRLRPAAWVLWRKSEQEIIVVIEPTECLSAEEWRQVSQQGA